MRKQIFANDLDAARRASRKFMRLLVVGCAAQVALGVLLLQRLQTIGEAHEWLKPLGLSLIFVSIFGFAIAANAICKTRD